MIDRSVFIATICANPHDDGPRLVYADWLEEQGEPDRAELIRVQIEIAEMEFDSAGNCRPRWVELGQRERKLAAKKNHEQSA